MQVLSSAGLEIAGIAAVLPRRAEDNLARCRELFGDERRAAEVVAATGIRSRRVAAPGVTSLDLCTLAARSLLEKTGAAADEIGAVVSVTLTPERIMPGNAAQAQKRLKLGNDVVALDLTLACSGWLGGLFTAGSLAAATGRKVLLLDGDVQSAALDPGDASTVPVLADAGTATLVVPAAEAAPWRFSFLTEGEGGEALVLAPGGKIRMDGFSVFRFVAGGVTRFLKDFLGAIGRTADDFDAFAPHQANAYMVRQLAKSIGFPAEKTLLSVEEYGNSASASVPVTIASAFAGAPKRRRRVLASGFGGGLSATAAELELGENTVFHLQDCPEP